MKTAVYTAMVAAAVLCVVLMVGGLLGCDALLELINTPEELMQDSMLYLDIYIWGLPFVLFYNIANGIFSALGDSRTPFIFLAASSTSNIAVDILFVTAFDMGVAGVAWATFLCQGVSCVLAIVVIFRRLEKIQLEMPPCRFSWQILKQITLIAVPSILQQSSISVGNIIIQSIINGFGSSVIAGYSAAVKLNNLVLTSFTTLGNGISNYTSQNIGAEKLYRVRDGFRVGIRMLWIITLPFFLLYFFGGRSLLYLLIDEPTAITVQTGVDFLRILSPLYFVVSIKLVSDGILRGSGRMKAFMMTTMLDLVLRVILASLFSKTALGATGIWCAWPAGWVIATGLSYWNYRRGPWMHAVCETTASAE